MNFHPHTPSRFVQDCWKETQSENMKFQDSKMARRLRDDLPSVLPSRILTTVLVGPHTSPWYLLASR